MFVNLAEYPAVPVRGTRFRIQVMAAHTPEQARRGASAIADAIGEARATIDDAGLPILSEEDRASA
ncbi:MAG TPA: hypothetical protein VE871_03030 [Longimicrobium sp.]|nr:hypothetical protein [Longimicrobium sp.]